MPGLRSRFRNSEWAAPDSDRRITGPSTSTPGWPVAAAPPLGVGGEACWPDRTDAGTGGPPAAGTRSAGRTLTRGGATTMLRWTKAPSRPPPSELPRPEAEVARPPGNRRAGGVPKPAGMPVEVAGRSACDAAARTVEGSAADRRITGATAPAGLRPAEPATIRPAAAEPESPVPCWVAPCWVALGLPPAWTSAPGVVVPKPAVRPVACCATACRPGRVTGRPAASPAAVSWRLDCPVPAGAGRYCGRTVPLTCRRIGASGMC